jgi:hypothetical protein
MGVMRDKREKKEEKKKRKGRCQMMKKILAALFIAALAIPAMADVAITATDAGSQNCQISFAGPADAVRGIALTVTVTGGTIESGAFISSSFNTFVDYAFYTKQAGYEGPVYAISMTQQHPFALEEVPGVATFPIASTAPFAVSVGYLDQAGTKLGLTSGSVALFHISGIPDNGSAIVTFTANATRGGAVVGEAPLGNVTIQPQVMIAGPVVVTNYTLAMSAGANGTVTDNSGTYAPGAVVNLVANPNANYKFVNWTGDTANIANVNAATTTITMNANATIVANFVLKTCKERLTATEQALYTRYVTAGKDPSSWCWQYQCRGDADGIEQGTLTKVRVGSVDLSLLTASWNKKPETGADPRADFDHAEQGTLTKVSVGSADLSLLVANWNKKTSLLTSCPTYVP